MSEAPQIAELERRLSSALERIGSALDGLARPEAETAAASVAQTAAEPNIQSDGGAQTVEAAAEIAQLRDALDEERLANAQLEERLKRLKLRSDAAQDLVQKELETAKGSLQKLDGELQRLRRANSELRAAAVELRAAASEGGADPHLVNKAMAAELEAVRAAQAADAAEAEAILTALRPLVASKPETETEEA